MRMIILSFLFCVAIPTSARGNSAGLIAAGVTRAACSKGSSAVDDAVARMPTSAPSNALLLSEIYRMPVGPRGLEYSDRAKALADQTVTIDGFLITQSMPVPGQLLLGPTPMQLHEHEYGFAEDLPANIVHVILVDAPDQTLTAARSRVRIQGRLRLGARNEPDGRVSHVRIECARDDVKFVDVSAEGLRPAPANTSACGDAH